MSRRAGWAARLPSARWLPSSLRSPSPRFQFYLRAIRDGGILAGLIFAGYLFIVLAPRARTVGLDAYAYWSLDVNDLYGRSQGAVLGPGAFRYSPPVAAAFAPFGSLPFTNFLLLYESILVGTIIWLGYPRPRWILAILAFPPVAVELYYGNVHLLLAAAVVLGFRHPWTWALVLLTKITPGVGLVWFIVRREWHALGVALGATIAVTLISLVLAPDLWREWLETLLGNRTVQTTNSLPIPLIVRLPLAALLVAWGARSDRPWTVGVGATMALPVLWIHGLAMLASLGPFLFWRKSEPKTSSRHSHDSLSGARVLGSRCMSLERWWTWSHISYVVYRRTRDKGLPNTHSSSP